MSGVTANDPTGPPGRPAGIRPVLAGPYVPWPPAGTPEPPPGSPAPSGGAPAWPPNGRYHPSPPTGPAAQHRSHMPLGGRAPRRGRWNRALNVVGAAVAVGGTLGVAGAAFALSFDAIAATARAAYVSPELAWLFPVAVDGAVAVAVVNTVLLRQLGRPTWYPWLVVLAGAGISMTCNALHALVQGGAIALPPRWAMAVATVPALLLALAIHLVVVLVVAMRPAPDPEPAPERARPVAARGAAPAPERARPARRPTPGAQPNGRAPAGAAPADPAPTPDEAPGGGRPAPRVEATDEQLVATLAARHPGRRVTNKEAAATLREAHDRCADRRARAAAKEHNARLDAAR